MRHLSTYLSVISTILPSGITGRRLFFNDLISYLSVLIRQHGRRSKPDKDLNQQKIDMPAFTGGNSIFSAFSLLSLRLISIVLVMMLTSGILIGNTVDGVIASGEYGNHTNGQNQQTNGATWYMNWDDNNLYIALSNIGNSSNGNNRRILFYIDKDPQVSVNGGSNANGNLSGFSYSNTNLGTLPFRADCFFSIETGYRQLNAANGSGGWSSNNTSYGIISFGSSNDVVEMSIPWSTITAGGSRPSSFNWTGYITDNNAGGNYFFQMPLENPSGIIGTSIPSSSQAGFERYYTVSTTTMGSATPPFGRNSFVFNRNTDITGFGAISCYDFTMNTEGRTITRGSGDWVVNGNFRIESGLIYFGSTTDKAYVDGHLNIGAVALLQLSNASGGDLYLKGNWTRSSGDFYPNNRAVFFNGTGNQSITAASGNIFSYVIVDKVSGKLVLVNDVSITNDLTLTNGIVDTRTNLRFVHVDGNIIRTNGWIDGRLRRANMTNSSYTFPVGTSVYTPVVLTFSGISNGAISIMPTSGNPAGGSGIDQTKKCNTWWNIDNGGATISAASAQFNLTNTTNTGTIANYKVKKYNTSWASTTSSVSGDMITATGLTSFSDFEIGELTCIPPTNLSYTSNTVTYCVDEAITTNSPAFSGSAATSYSVIPALPSGLSLNPTTGDITGTPTTATAAADYTVTVTNACGNTTRAVNIRVLEIPSLPMVGSNSPICSGSNLNLTSTASGTAPFTYSWTGPNGFSSSDQNSIISAATTAATGTYHVTITNGCGSTNTSVVATVNATPDAPTLSGVAHPTCTVATGSFDITNYNPSYTYTTNPTSNISLNVATYTAGSGTYLITSALGTCTATSAPVTVNVQPTTLESPLLGGVAHPTCIVSTGSFDITNYNPSYTYTTNPTSNISLSGATYTAGPNTYSIMATYGACTGTSLPVTVNPQPTVLDAPLLSSVTQPTCTSSTGSFTVTNYSTAYIYSTNPTSNISVNAPTYTAGPNTYTITATLGTCSGTSSPVTVNAQPTAIEAPLLSGITHPTCTVATGSFEITNYSTSYAYTVNPSAGVTINLPTITTPPGIYTVTATYGNCTGTSTSVTVNSQPTTLESPLLGGVTHPTCTVGTGSFDITNYIPSYSYSTNPTSNISLSGYTYTAGPGTYTITATLGTCSGTSSPVTVNPQPTTLELPLLSGVTHPTCTVGTGSFEITNYSTSYVYSTNPTSNISFNAPTYTASPNTYTITATLGTCSGTSSPVTVNVQPTTIEAPTLGPVTQPSCTVSTGSFTITNYSTLYAYVVNPSVGVTINLPTITAPPGTYTVTAQYGNCSGTSLEVIVNPQPVAVTYYMDADGDTYGDPGNSQFVCPQPIGYVVDNTDCDDTNPWINPNTIWYLDADADYYYTGVEVTQCASPGPGYIYDGLIGGGDCDDAVAAINPGATETCNSIDDNCDGLIDEGCPGAALDFDGVDDYVLIPNSPSLTTCTTCPITVEGWVYRESSAPVQHIMGKRNGCGFSSWQFQIEDALGGIGFAYSTNTIRDPQVMPMNQWMHFAGVFDGTNVKLYINGELKASVPGSLGTEPTAPVTIGRSGDCPMLWDGKMDDIRIWNRALCQAEILSTMNCEIPTTSAGLVANYHFNRGTASGDNTGVTALTDVSGNNNNGTLNNFALSGGNSNWIAPGAVTSGSTCGALNLTTYFRDADGDTFGDASISRLECYQPSGYVINSTDCDDNDINKWRTGTFYVDGDGDSYGANAEQFLCYGNTTPSGYSINNTDCNDAVAAINPGATEIFDGFDNDCDGFVNNAPSLNHFVTKWNTGTGTTIQFPGEGTNYTIYWEDFNIPSVKGSLSGNGTTIIDFTTAGTYKVYVTPGAGTFTRFNMNNGTDKEKLLDVNQWGTIAWSSMENAFHGCLNLNITATDLPVLTNVASMSYMFTNCSTLNSPANINSWNTSNVTEMAWMFSAASVFNQPIGSWSTVNVITMRGMFYHAHAFNQTISGWNTSNASNLSWMFVEASAFNQPLGTWTLKNGVDLADMLFYCGMDCSNYSATLTGWKNNVNTPNNLNLGAAARTYNCEGKMARDYLTGIKSWIITGDSPCEAGPSTWYQDSDEDGYGKLNEFLIACTQPSGYVVNNTDCDDTNPALNPTTIWYLDADADNYYAGAGVTQCASPGTGYRYIGLTGGADCDDGDATKFPGNPEVCDGKDNNCDGNIDEGVTNTYYADADGDGFGDPLSAVQSCTLPIGYVNNAIDCDDNFIGFVDNDFDGFGYGLPIPCGGAPNPGDCDDDNPSINPFALEICNGVDDNCNFLIDDDDPSNIGQPIWYADFDTDGYGDALAVIQACIPPVGYVFDNTDCDDNDINKWRTGTFYVDGDGDSYGAGSGQVLCYGLATPSGYSTNNTDCNDAVAAINPGATEICDGVDNNCVNGIDEGFTTLSSLVIGSNSPICAGFNLNLSSSANGSLPFTYSWTGPNSFSSTNQNPVITAATTAATGTYYVTITNACGSISGSTEALVNALPSTSIITGSNSVCTGSTGVAYSVTNTPGSSYIWTITGGTQASGGTTNSITVNWGAAGSGNVRVVETNAETCVGTAVNRAVAINAYPITSAISGSNSVCAGTTSIAYIVTNTVGSTYVWTITGGTQASGSTTNSITVNWGAAGSGNISVMETNASNCVGTPVNLDININEAAPVFGYNYDIATNATLGDATIDGAGNLYTAYSVGANIYIKRNRGAAELVSPGSNPAIAVDASGNIHIIYTNSGLKYKKRTGAVWSAERAVPGGTVFYSIDTDSGGAAHIAADDGGTGGRGHIVYIKDNDGTWSAPIWEATGWFDYGQGRYYHLPVIRIDNADNYHIAYQYDSWGGNANWSSRYINIHSNSVYGDKGSSDYNWNAGVSLTKNSLTLNGAEAYIAYTNGGTQNIAQVNSSWTVLHSVAAGGGSAFYKSGKVGVSYLSGVNVNYIESAGAGFTCSNTIGAATNAVPLLGSRYVFYLSGTTLKLASSEYICIEPMTSPITGINSVCDNSTGVLYSVTNTSGSTYAWTITGGTQVSGGTTNSITVDWGAAGSGNVQAMETTSEPCGGMAVNLSVTINAYPNTSAISGFNSVCANSTGVVYSVTNIAGSTYVWTIVGGTQVSGGTTNSITVDWGAGGLGNVRVVETNAANCVGEAVDLGVTINAIPTTSAINGTNNICANSTGVSYSVTNTAGSTYVWTITGGIQVSGGTTNSITVDWGSAGSGNVRVVETNAASCVGAAVDLAVNDSQIPTVASIPISGASVVGYTCGQLRTFNTDPNSCASSKTIIKPLWADNCVIMSSTAAANNGVTISDFGAYVSASFPVGITTVTFTGTDNSNNANTCTLIVEVKDIIPPMVVNCPTNISVMSPVNACSAIVVWTPPTAFDNCSGVSLVQTSSPTIGLGIGSAFPIGVTTILYTATDASGNTATCSFTVTVIGTCGIQTEFTTTFQISAFNFVKGSPGTTRVGIYTVDNVGTNDNNTPVHFTISAPFTNFSSFVPTLSGTVDIGGIPTATNNGDWNITPIVISPFGTISYDCVLKPGVIIGYGQRSVITLSFTALENAGQGQTTGQVLDGTGGDQNEYNNYSQGTFTINN